MTKNQFNLQLGKYRNNPERLKRFLLQHTRKPAVKVRLTGQVSKQTLVLMSIQVKKELAKKYGW